MRHARRIPASTWAVVVAAVLALAVPAAARDYQVRYLSADFVYLEGGTADGLAAGDTLRVTRGDVAVATVAVEHAAEHSAACRIVVATQPVKAGDVARLLREKPAAPAAPTAAARATAPAPAVAYAPARAAAPRTRPWADVSGYAAVQWYRFADRSGLGLDYTQPTLRLQLKARKLWGKALTLEIKGRARHDHRARRYNDAVPADEWSNRVYAFSLAYDDPDATINWQVGRIISNALAATGPVDGALVEARLSRDVRGGAFGGTLPDWRDSSPRGTLQKFGVFLRAAHGDFGGHRWSAALAGTAEYHGSTVSRQYVYLQTDVQSGRRLSVYHSVELDLNNGWRRAAGAKAVSLTNAYVSASWRPTDRASLGLGYDSRRSYRTWDNRSLPDSLFDAALRTGLRANAALRLGGNWSAFGTGGLQHRVGDRRDTRSWSGGLTCDNLLDRRLRVTLQAAGFSGPWASGVNPSLQVQKSFPAGHLLGLAAGAYLYTPSAAGSRRENDWARLDGTVYLSSRFYLSAQYERDWGLDVRGDRMLAEAGLNF